MLPLHVLSMDSEGKILGHDTILVNNFNTRSLEILAEITERIVIIKLGTE